MRNKVIGCGFLSWQELEEVLLDVEISLNDQPLSYVEDDVALPIFTPNSMMFPPTNILPDLEPHHIADADLQRRAKYLRKCKATLWKRWSNEYLRSLREKHNLKHSGKPCTLAVGDVVIIKSQEKNRGKWPLGIVQDFYPGRDGFVRAVKLPSGTSSKDQCSIFTPWNFLLTPLSVDLPESLMLTRQCSDQGDGRLYSLKKESVKFPEEENSG